MVDDILGSADAAEAWARSGMMFLTGPAGGPALGGPEALVEVGRSLARDIARRSARLGRPVLVDPLALMVERAATGGYRRGGQVSCGGASRLMRSADGWMAVTMARPTDWDLVPALVERSEPVRPGEWAALQTGVAALDSRTLSARA